MQDKELAKLFGLPTSTIADWKSKKNLNGNVKFLLYKFISTLPDELVKERIEAIKLIEDIEVVGKNEFIEKVLNNIGKFDIFDGYEIQKPQEIESLNLCFKDMRFFKNEYNEYIAVHFYFQFRMSVYGNLERIQKNYITLQENMKINKIYLITSGTNPAKVQSSVLFEKIENLVVYDVSYFTSKLYSRKNIIFWHDGSKFK